MKEEPSGALGAGPKSLGCAMVVVLMIGLPAVGLGYWWNAQADAELAAQEAQVTTAAQVFAPVYDKLDEAIKQPSYDLDKTVRVLHEIDLALAEKDSLNEYLQALSRQDYRDVAPEVLEARKEVLDVLMRLYAKQVEVEDQEAMWEITSQLLLTTLSVVSVSAEANMLAPSGSVSIDRAQARGLLDDLKQRQSDHHELLIDITETEQELFDALYRTSEVYHRYQEEWEQLSVLRDRSYLAAHNGDWAAAQASAELAIEMAPMEREAHLIAALARIEQGTTEDGPAIAKLLNTYITEHPDRSAPAFLLLGVLHQRSGNSQQALLAFQQSAAYYPKQAEHLTDMLDPYRTRSFLNQSREGGFIVELYKSTMLGAGYFSPDLQMARMMFEDGDDAGAKAKVLDHFARRRAQQQWDFVLSDISFCHEVLGPHFWEIFPEDTYLDLEVSPALWGSFLTLSVNNRSARSLHNATLVLALHYTDMYPNTYEALAAEFTVPAVVAGEVTSFGSVEIATAVHGIDKTIDDIVDHRAILVTDEAVSWVDTQAFKTSESAAFRNHRQERLALGKEAPDHPAKSRHPAFAPTAETLLQSAFTSASLQVESRYGSDDVLVELPKELAILRPLFQLRYNGELYQAQDNLIDGDAIKLRFSGVNNFDDGEAGDLELLLASPFGDVVLTWTPGADLTWRFAGRTAE